MASATERAPWLLAMVNFCMDAIKTKPVARICFSLQLLYQALGGEDQTADAGWGIGLHCYTIKYYAGCKGLQTGENTMLVFHMDQVKAIPPGAMVLAKSDFCPHVCCD